MGSAQLESKRKDGVNTVFNFRRQMIFFCGILCHIQKKLQMSDIIANHRIINEVPPDY